MIDYAAQFKLIDYTTADELTVEHKRHRVYTSAEKAFRSAQRTESLGIDVAFATTGFGQYHVWAEPRDLGTYPICDRCSRSVAHTSKAVAGDLNSADWCDVCVAEDDEVTAMTEVGEEAIDEMVAVKCVACAHVVTDRAVMARMWCVDTQCPACGDGALLWDDGSLGYSV